MLAFVAKLAGPLLILLALGASGFVVADRAPERSFPENLASYSQSFAASAPSRPETPLLAPLRVRPPRLTDPKEDLSGIGPAIDDLLQAQPGARLGVAVRWSNGETLYMRNAQEPFPLASVAKTYMLVAYLDRLENENRVPNEDEMELLRSMIDVSDNESAQEIWDSLGGLDAMQAYLGSIGMKPLIPPPLEAEGDNSTTQSESWGDVSQSASEMSLFLARLWQKELLNADFTQIARTILGSVVEEQAWGVTTDVDVLDPEAQVLFKNGWYPSDGSWRINSAGIVIPAQGEPYVIVIFGDGFDSWSDGVETVNGVAVAINRLLLP
jgi:hypothetical protein